MDDTKQSFVSSITCSGLNTGIKSVNYSDLFSKNLDVVTAALKNFQVRWKKRESLLLLKKETSAK